MASETSWQLFVNLLADTPRSLPFEYYFFEQLFQVFRFLSNSTFCRLAATRLALDEFSSILTFAWFRHREIRMNTVIVMTLGILLSKEPGSKEPKTPT